MRFAIGTTALLLANCEASTDVKSSYNRIKSAELEAAAGVNKPISLHGTPQSGNQRGLHRRQLRDPAVKKLIRRLAEKTKGRAIQSGRIVPEGNEALLPLADDPDHASPDMGVIGGRNREKGGRRRRRRVSDIKESIMDQNSVREKASEDEIDAVTSFPIDNYNSSSTTSNDEYDSFLNEYNTFMLSNLEYICNGPCDCGNFDVEAVNGTVECSYYTEPDGSDYCQSTINYCGEPVEICYRETMVLGATDPENYSYTTCFTYTEPYQQHVCLTFDHSEEEEDSNEADTNADNPENPKDDGWFSFIEPSSLPCSVTFNNVECKSCSTEIETFQQNSINEETGESEIVAIAQERCFKIDCSNTGDDTNIINTCEGDSFPTTLRKNVVFGDDCTRCQPCGIGHRIQNLDAEGYFPMIGEYQCNGLELAAKVGFFDRKLCPEVQAKTAEYCGCKPLFFNPDLMTSRNDRSTSYESPVFLPGNTVGDSACDVCGSEKAIVANPHAIVTLPSNFQTSCAALQAAGRLGMFTSDYCRSHVMPLVFVTCGGCFHDQDVNIFDSDSIVGPVSGAGDEPAPSEDDSNNSHADIPTPTEDSSTHSLSTSMEGGGMVSCQLCDTGSQLALPDNVVSLSEGEIGEISCRAFEDGLKKAGTTFTESFCFEEASAIADTYCGGCIATPTPATTSQAASLVSNNALKLSKRNGGQDTGKDDGVGIVVSQMNGDGESDRKQTLKPEGRVHSEAPDEIDVWTDVTAVNEDTEPIANSASSTVTSGPSSQSLTAASKTWMLVTTAMAVPFSVVVYFS